MAYSQSCMFGSLMTNFALRYALDWDQIARGCLQSHESTEFSEDEYIDRKCVGQTDRAKVSKLFMSCDFRTSPFEWLQIRNQQQALRNTVNLARIKNISFEIHEVALYVHHNGEAS